MLYSLWGLLLSVGACQCASLTLIVTDKATPHHNYSRFWESLRRSGHELIFRDYDAVSPHLQHYGEAAFDNMIFLATATKNIHDDLSPRGLVQFLENGGNIVFAASSNISEQWRDFAREFDIDFDDAQTSVKDHFVGTGPQHTLLALDPASISSSPATGTASLATLPVLYRGIGHRRGFNPLLIDVLSASPGSTSDDILQAGDTVNPFIGGKEIALVSAFQSLANARVVFLGSLDAFSDDLWRDDSSSNSEFLTALTSWAFQESGVLRVLSSRHYSPQGAQSKVYRVGQDVVYEVQIQARRAGNWGPYPASDVQVELSMLDPYLRTTLRVVQEQPQSTNTTLLAASLRMPDRHGVFTIEVDYRRAGWTFLRTKQQISVTPLRHDEYPRFLSGAMPYYAGATSLIASFFYFAISWVAHQPGKM